MIKFHDLPSNEAAQMQMAAELVDSGYTRAEAERLADAAATITLATMRSLDQKVTDAVTDENERTVVQQLVLSQMIGICRKGIEVNAVSHFAGLLDKLFKGGHR